MINASQKYANATNTSVLPLMFLISIGSNNTIFTTKTSENANASAKKYKRNASANAKINTRSIKTQISFKKGITILQQFKQSIK